MAFGRNKKALQAACEELQAACDNGDVKKTRELIAAGVPLRDSDSSVENRNEENCRNYYLIFASQVGNNELSCKLFEAIIGNKNFIALRYDVEVANLSTCAAMCEILCAADLPHRLLATEIYNFMIDNFQTPCHSLNRFTRSPDEYVKFCMKIADCYTLRNDPMNALKILLKTLEFSELNAVTPGCCANLRAQMRTVMAAFLEPVDELRAEILDILQDTAQFRDPKLLRCVVLYFYLMCEKINILREELFDDEGLSLVLNNLKSRLILFPFVFESHNCQYAIKFLEALRDFLLPENFIETLGEEDAADKLCVSLKNIVVAMPVLTENAYLSHMATLIERIYGLNLIRAYSDEHQDQGRLTHSIVMLIISIAELSTRLPKATFSAVTASKFYAFSNNYFDKCCDFHNRLDCRNLSENLTGEVNVIVVENEKLLALAQHMLEHPERYKMSGAPTVMFPRLASPPRAPVVESGGKRPSPGRDERP